MIIDIAITTLISVLTLIAEHYFPWGVMVGKQLPRITAYVLGILGLIVPLSLLYCFWLLDPPTEEWAYLAALLSVVIFGGLAVIGCYGLDWLITQVIRAKELQEILDKRDVKR